MSRSRCTTCTVLSLAAVVLLTTASSCARGLAALGDDFGRASDEVVDGVRQLPDGTFEVPGLPGRSYTGSLDNLAPTAEEAAAATTAPHVDGLEAGQAREVIDVSCRASDLMELAGASSAAEAVETVLVNEGRNATFRYRMENLAEDIAQMRSSGEVAAAVTAATICEVAGATG